MLLFGKVGDIFHEDFTVVDSSANLVIGIDTSTFTHNIFDPTGAEVSSSVPVTFVELGFGHYRSNFRPNIAGIWYLVVYHHTYFPWGKSGSIQVFGNDFDSIATLLQRVLGLVQENFCIDQTVYDDNNCMISGRIRIYDSAISVGTDIGVIAIYRIEADWTDGIMTSYRVIRL